MRKFRKKLCATLLGTVLAVSPVISALPVMADSSFTVTYNANGGTIDGESTKQYTISPTHTVTRKAYSSNVDAEGESTGEKLQPLSSDEKEIVSTDVQKDGKVYKLSSATITGQYQTGSLYEFELVDEDDNPLVTGDPQSLNNIDVTTYGAATVRITESDDLDPDEVADNSLFGHYVEATAEYFNMTDIPVPTPENSDKTFDGWYLDADFTTEWDPESADPENVEVYAKWSDGQSQGGEGQGGEGQGQGGEGQGQGGEGQGQGGEDQGQGGEGQGQGGEGQGQGGEGQGQGGEGHIDLGGDYTISYDLDGGTLPDGAPTSYTGDVDVTLLNPTKDGFDFLGWTSDEILTPSTVVVITAGSEGDKYYTANWQESGPATYSITCDLGADDASYPEGQSNPTEYTSATDTFHLVNPVRDGYNFLGWTGTGLLDLSDDVVILQGSEGDRTYLANWEQASQAATYTITYVLGDGASFPDGVLIRTEYTSADDDFELPTPEKEGFDFTGWTFEGQDTPVKPYTLEQGSEGDKTFTANWTESQSQADSYTITYNLDGGTLPDGAPTSYTGDVDVTLLNPTKDGFDFIGWTSDEMLTPSTLVVITAGTVGDKTYTANWQEEQSQVDSYTITYNLDGGVFGVDANVLNSYTAETDDYVLPEPAKEGYSFTGWTFEGQDTPITPYTLVKGSEGDKVFTANWDELIDETEYTITYEVAEGATYPEGQSNPTTYKASSPDITLVNPSLDGFTFLGWLVDGEGSPVLEVVIPHGSTGNKEFVATFMAEQPIYTITYEDIRDADVNNPIAYEKGDTEITIADPTNEDFLGWTCEQLNITEPTKGIVIPVGTEGDLTIKANWSTQGQYYLNYDLDGGELPIGEDNPLMYTSSDTDITLSLIKPTREDSIFIGWTSAELGIEEPTETIVIPAGTKKDLSLVAKYAGLTEEFTITYDLDGGELPEGAENPATYTPSTEGIVLVNPTKEGAEFVGWTGTDLDEANPSKEVTIETGSYGNREYKAVWLESDEYMITYEGLEDAVFAEGEENPIKYKADSEPITLNNPTKEGFEFLGWTCDELMVIDPTTEFTIPTGTDLNLTVEANWTKIYTITYDGLEDATFAEGEDNPETYIASDEAIKIYNPTREDAEFVGWICGELEITHPTTEFVIPSGTTGDLKLTAVWNESEKYTITYEGLEGAKFAEDEKNPDSYRTSNTPIRLFNPTKEDYVFVGWSCEALGIEATTRFDIPFETKGNLIIVANWAEEGEVYGITYDLNDGTLPEGTENPDYYSTEDDDIMIVNPVREGYTFKGWSGTGIKIGELEYDLVIPHGSMGDRHYEANWDELEEGAYAINYKLNGGQYEEGEENPLSYKSDDPDYTLNNPTKEGYKFLGWTCEQLGVDEPTDPFIIKSGTDGTLTIVANWEPALYKITYELDGGIDPGNPKYYTIEDEVNLTAPTKKDYTFAGWTGTGLTEPTMTVKIPKGSVGDRTYKATWKSNVEPTEYKITYDLDGGVMPTGKSNPTSYTEEDSFTLYNPTKEGYTFAGWTGTDLTKATLAVIIAKGSKGDRAYKATWTPVTKETGSLYIHNEVKGTGANLDKKFQFTIGIYDGDKGVNETYVCTGITDSLTFKNGLATVKLAHDEDITITGIPAGFAITIDQEAVDGYTTTPESRHIATTMKANSKLSAKFINTRNVITVTPTPTTVPTVTPTPTKTPTTVPTVTPTPTSTSTSSLTFNHVTNGDSADKDKKFVYTLTVTNNGSPITGSYSYSGTGSGTVAFSSEGKISFTMKDGQTLKLQSLPTGAVYSIAKNDTTDGYTLTKSRNDGQITGDVTVTLTETKGNVNGTNGTNGTTTTTTSGNGTNGDGSTTGNLSNVKTGDTNPIIPIAAVGIVALVVAIFFLRKRETE